LIAARRGRRAETPFAAISRLNVMGYLLEWAVDAGIITDNHARGVKKPKAKMEGFKAWTPDDLEKS
jgi:hypothetical protein